MDRVQKAILHGVAGVRLRERPMMSAKKRIDALRAHTKQALAVEAEKISAKRIRSS
jgi:hypothetical protein